jgi:protein gp37
MGDWAEGRSDQRWYLDHYLFPVIVNTPWLIWLLLTKRPQIAAKIVPENWRHNGWPKNAWPGTTAVTQKWWDLRVPALMNIPASQHFVSAEPLMEPIDMSAAPLPSWVITGGQSGKSAKPSHPDWFRGLRDQCLAERIPFHFKQHGEWQPLSRTDGVHELPFGRYNTQTRFGFLRVGKRKAGRLLDGREWNEFPAGVSL